MKKLIAGLAVAMVALTGCGGGGMCSDLKDGFNHAEKQSSACGDDTDGTVDAFNNDRCEANEDSCNDDEQKALSEVGDCLGELSTCSPATEDAWGLQALACITKVQGRVGQTCITAVFGAQ